MQISKPLRQACLDYVTHWRPAKAKGAIAEGLVGLILDACPGKVVREPDLTGKRPDYEWIVAPELPSSFRFLIEVVYLDSNDNSVKRVQDKVYKYRPVGEHQYYVVAAVYEEGLDIKEIRRPCMSKLSINLAIDTNTGESSTDESIIPQEYTTGYASMLWLISFPPNVSERI